MQQELKRPIVKTEDTDLFVPANNVSLEDGEIKEEVAVAQAVRTPSVENPHEALKIEALPPSCMLFTT